jgi:mRNA interferase MazF
MTSFKQGDVVVVDLGHAGKVRPCVVVSIPKPDSQRHMTVVVPITTEARSGQSEVAFPKPPWLKQASVVNLLGIVGLDNAKIGRVLGTFPSAQFQAIEDGLARILGL